MLIEFEGKRPKVHSTAYVAETAVVIGDVVIGSHSSVWPGAVIRADYGPIRIGDFTSIQDNCVLHVESPDSRCKASACVIGNYVTVGHGAVVHGCIVEDNCMIGIHATVFNNAVIKKGSTVGMNALVTEGKVFGPASVVMGVPAKEIRKLSPEEEETNHKHAESYARLAERHNKKNK